MCLEGSSCVSGVSGEGAQQLHADAEVRLQPGQATVLSLKIVLDLGMVTYTCNLSTQEIETGES